MRAAKCVTGKNSFLNQETAEEALIETNIRFDFAEGHGPIAVYRCDDCGLFHLTSRGPMNERLQDALRSGRISRQKDADHWARKFRK